MCPLTSLFSSGGRTPRPAMTSQMTTIVSWRLDGFIGVMSLFHSHQVSDYKLRLSREIVNTAKCCCGRNRIRPGRTVVKGSRYGKAIRRPTLQQFSEKCRHDSGPESEAHEHSPSVVLVPAEIKSEGWATLYNRVGVVKRHVDQRKVLTFPFVEGFGVAVVLAIVCAHATNARL